MDKSVLYVPGIWAVAGSNVVYCSEGATFSVMVTENLVKQGLWCLGLPNEIIFSELAILSEYLAI